MNRIVLLAFCTLFWGIASYAHCSPVFVSSSASIDSLHRQGQIYCSEDPQRGQLITKELLSISRTLRSPERKSKSFLLLAESYLSLSYFDEAKRYIDSSIRLCKRNNLHSQLIESLRQSARLAFATNSPEVGIRTLAEARAFAVKHQLFPEEIAVALSLGDAQRSLGDFSQSVRTKRSAIERAMRSGNQPLVADCWVSLGGTFWNSSHYTEALECYYKASIVSADMKDTLRSVYALKNLGLVYRDLGNFDKSASHLNQALRMAELLGNDIETSNVLNLLGSLHYKFNRYTEALLYYNQSLEKRRRLGLHSSTATTLENIARVYTQKGQFDEAIAALDEALSLKQQLFNPLLEAITLNEMGNLYLQKGNIAEALRRYLMSLRIRENAGSSDDIAQSYTNIGLTYRKLGLTRNATSYLEKARELILESNDPSGAAYILVNLGNLYIDQKYFDKALRVFQEALAMREKTGDETSIARTLRNIAQAQVRIGQIDRARNSLTQALKISKRLNDGRAIADTYNELGNLEREAKNLTKAIANFEIAAQTYDETALFDGKALCYRKIGELQVELGLLDAAEKNINQSLRIGRELGNHVLIEYGYLAKHELLKAKGNYKQALVHYAMHIKIRDSIENARRSEANLEAQLDLELDKKKEEIKLMEGEVENLRQRAKLNELEIEKQRIYRNYLIALILLIVSIAGTAIFAFLQKRRHTRILEDNLMVIQDVNDKLSRSEADLLLNLQTKDKLFSIIAHDLKSPFTALVGLTEVLVSKADEFTPDEIREFSRHIYESSSKLLTLIENLLAWSRSQSGKLMLSPESVNLKGLVDSCVEIVSMAANDKSIAIVSRIDPNHHVYADRETLMAVVRNLLSNAVKFTPNNGRISVSSNPLPDSMELLIADNGVGIEPENLEKLFRVDGYTTRGTNQERGTGLGLLICKEFVEKNGGRISVDSEVGIGTTFRIELPTQGKDFNRNG